MGDPRLFLLGVGVLLAAAPLAGCAAPEDDGLGPGDDDAGPGDDDSGPPPDDDAPAWPLIEGDCDPMVPSHCGFPFPSNVWLAPDPATETGGRVAFGEGTLPVTVWGQTTDPSLFDHLDGFSPATPIMTHMPGAVGTGLADPEHIELSLEPDSKTVIIEAESGAWVPHFAELDMSHDDDERRALILRPAVRLENATRYIVAIRGLVDAEGRELPPSDVFAALRDGEEHDDPSVEMRRALYDDILARLEAAGVPRDDLQLAWDFTTASQDALTSRALTMRDEALSELGEGSPQYAIDIVQDDVNEHIARRIEGRITVPLYLDDPGPGGTLLVDADGRPVRNGTAEYPFLILIPWSATEQPRPLLQFGHGLFGSRYSMEDPGIEEQLDRMGYVGFSMDWLGMSEEDPGHIAAVIFAGDLAGLRTVPDRGLQAFVNKILMMRLMHTGMTSEPAMHWDGQLVIDPDERYYYGGSQGGIYGTSLMALHVDVTRGVLAVPGLAYSLMLPRSVHFEDFHFALESVFDDPLAIQLTLGYAQMIWDRTEPSGYAPHVQDDPLPGSPEKTVLILEAIGDHQVPNLASHLLARTVGAVMLEPPVRDLFGLEVVEAPYASGSVFVEYDFGLPPVPIENVPMQEGEDPHGALIGVEPALQMIDTFLRTGVAEQYCDGVCDPA